MNLNIDDKEIQESLQKLIDTQLPQAIEQGLDKACLAVEGAAKVLVPVDDGQLRQSISHEVNGIEGYVGTNVEYAPYVELGTGIHAKQGGRQTPWIYRDSKGEFHKTSGQRPQPFLKPAAEQSRNAILESFKGVLDNNE